MKEFRGTKGKAKLFRKCFKNEYGFYVQPISISSEEGILFANTYGRTKIETESNAKLIAAALEMLEMLQNLENDNNSIPKIFWDKRNELLTKILE